MWTQRNSTVFHPIWDMLASRYLELFAFRVWGRSIDQPGDPVPRWVIHCQSSNRLFSSSPETPRMGKSSLARGLGRGQVVTVEIDSMLRRLLASMERADRPILELLETYRGVVPKSYRNIVLGIEAAGLSAEFADLIFSHIPLDEDLVIIEGYGLRGETLARLQERLESVAYVWGANRLDLLSGDDAKETELEALRVQVSQLRRTSDELRRSAAATNREFEALVASESPRGRQTRSIATASIGQVEPLWAAELVKPIIGGSTGPEPGGESSSVDRTQL